MFAVHIVSSLDLINFGVWNVVVSTFQELRRYGVKSELWSLKGKEQSDLLRPYAVCTKDTVKALSSDIRKKYEASNTIIVTHGCWTFPTRVGHELYRYGYKWICYPHGMLEPWALQHHSYKKKLYFDLFERRYLKKADAIVAVGAPEFKNLCNIFSNKICHIHNGVEPYEQVFNKPSDGINFLFMARLHAKKGVLLLVKAWAASKLANNGKFKLRIAGPDEGELNKIMEVLHVYKVNNIDIIGPVYNEKKEAVLNESHYFILPSQSEGFPTTIVEAMTHKCIPVITPGCNFPEALEAGVAEKITFDIEVIKKKLEELTSVTNEEMNIKGIEAKKFADDNFSIKKIAMKQLNLYNLICEKN